MAFDVLRIPVWQDNYAWVLAADDGTAALVDAPDAAPILALLTERGLRLTHIFNTHHHVDHVGSNDALIAAFPGLAVFAGEYDQAQARIPGQTRALADGERFTWGGVGCTVRTVAGHTLGHIAYLFDDGSAFVGDTIFVGGCGRLFEGTAQQLDHALSEVLTRLPDDTRLYCAHEYTASNLRFARSVDPDNATLAAYSEEVDGLRGEGLATVPSTVGLERAINPFVRADLPALRASAGCAADAPRHVVVGALRSMKDRF